MSNFDHVKFIDVVLVAHRFHLEPKTLLVDDDLAEIFKEEKSVACLSQLGLAPEELWACRGVGSMTLVVLSASRSAREMFRVLSLAERLVAPDGRILLLPVTDSASEEVRPEATEVFCGVHPEWSRRQVEGNVVELWRTVLPSYSKRDQDGVLEILNAIPSVRQSTRRQGERIVSLSVFGDHRFGTDFWKQMPAFVTNYVLAHHALFPGWELRVHHDEHLYHANGGDVLCGLARRGLVRLVHVPSRPGQGKCEKMLWRLLPAWDPEVEVVVCRDVDSLPTWRDRCCVEEFVASGLDAGTIHDNPEHGGMMGGLSHFRAGALREAHRSFEEFIAFPGWSEDTWSRHGTDQVYLNLSAKELFGGRVLEHSLRSRGVSTFMSEVSFRTTIAEPSQVVVESVQAAVREGSDRLTNYMGSSGYQTALARAFYDDHSPIAADVREAERFAREAAVAEGS